MNPAQLENLIGHKFSSPDILLRSITHRSWAHEERPGAPEETIRALENESLEFVGDSVLGLIVAEHLFKKHPDLSEGDLTLMKHHLVSTKTLARIAAELHLGQYVRMGRGEEKTAGRLKPMILANTLEAVIAAVFIDGGYAAARAFVTRVFADEFRKATPGLSLDYKSLLQETLQATGEEAPKYVLLRTEGQPHDRTFHVEAVWHGGRSHGTGRSLKAAEMDAASEALARLKKIELPAGAGKRS
jgi:ribonuclease-3